MSYREKIQKMAETTGYKHIKKEALKSWKSCKKEIKDSAKHGGYKTNFLLKISGGYDFDNPYKKEFEKFLKENDFDFRTDCIHTNSVWYTIVWREDD